MGKIKSKATIASLLSCGLSALFALSAQASNINWGHPSMSESAARQSLFLKYGGEATIHKVVDDAVAGVLADPEIAPYFAVVGKTGHDTVDRLKSCLDLQFTVLFGGPGRYPGLSHYRGAPPQGYTCQSMREIHQGLNIPSPVFNKFVADLAMVLKADGVSAEDIKAIAPALIALKPAVDVRGPMRRPHTPAGTVGRTLEDLEVDE